MCCIHLRKMQQTRIRKLFDEWGPTQAYIVLCTHLKRNETNMSLFHIFLDGRRAEGAVGWWMPQNYGRDILEQLWGGQEERELAGVEVWTELSLTVTVDWQWIVVHFPITAKSHGSFCVNKASQGATRRRKSHLDQIWLVLVSVSSEACCRKDT